MKNRIAQLEAQLRTAQHAANTGIIAMQAAANIFEVLRDVRWMKDIDPTGTGPKAACDSEAKHLNRLATDLKDKLNACTCGERDLPGLAHCKGCPKGDK